MLNLIDTPGHVDFSYEVSRSLAACQGAVLLVDAAQGIQAQTLAHFYLAFGEGLTIVPVLNKVDLDSAEPQRVAEQVQQLLETTEPLDPARQFISAKSGLHCDELLSLLIDKLPSPVASPKETKIMKALLFDSWYDAFRGVICLIAVKEGTLQKGDWLQSAASGKKYEVSEVGIMHPTEQALPAL